MPIKILMPALSPTMTEGNLARWFKKEGEDVSPGDILAEIETDKATMEVEAVDEGTLARIVVPEGTEGVKVNAVIGMMLEEGEDASALEDVDTGAGPPPPTPTPPAETPAAAPEAEAEAPPGGGNGAGGEDISATPLARRIAEQAGIDLAAIAGSGAHGRVVRADVEAAVAGPARGGQATEPAGQAAARTPDSGGRLFVSPLAARLAAEAGLDLRAVPGSGPGGRIVKADIDAAMSQPRPTTAPAAAPSGAARPAEPVPAGADYTVVPLSTMRKVVAERMTHSKQTAPHFYLTVECEIDEMLRVRAELNARAADVKLSVNDFIIRACAMALMEVPEANVTWDDGQLRQYRMADISVAVALDEGLITPIVRGAEGKGLARISSDMKDLAERARAGKLAPEEYQGGSFTISNLGMFGIKQFEAVINTPQACILAVGAGEKRPVVKDDKIVPATVMSCTLSCDHRAVDGAIGARLLTAIKRLVEYPPAMLL